MGDLALLFEQERWPIAAAGLLERVAALPQFVRAKTVMAYAAMPKELDVRPICEHAMAVGKRVVLPRADWTTKSMSVFEVRDWDADLVSARYGMREPRGGLAEVDPREIDLVLVPGQAFSGDGAGRRLGRGAGFYDRFLGRADVGAPGWCRLGICLDMQLVDELPVEEFDVLMHGVATPDRVVWTAERPD